MIAEWDKLDQPAPGESLCGYCRRPWFGLVAYCPYCGRKPNFTTVSQEPDDRPQGDEALSERPPPSQLKLNKKASTHLFETVVAGVAALLLFWMVAKLPAPKINEAASSPQLPISTSDIASSRRVPSTSAAQVPVIPARTDGAVPPRSSRLPCSVAHERAGLCKSQE